jgi:hypothetical protein
VIFDTQYNYFQSEGIGATNLRNEITYLIDQCPYVNILLGGYSQGAQVIGDVLVGLSAAQRNHIGAVTLWGDPSYRRSEVYDNNPATPDSGIFSRTPAAFSAYTSTIRPASSTTPITVPNVRSYCNVGDAFCQNKYPLGMTEHQSYNTSAGWAFMRQFLISTD